MKVVRIPITSRSATRLHVGLAGLVHARPRHLDSRDTKWGHFGI
ncbi:MAG: hypothetical protein ABGZ19_13140 [Verrucomicrobiales bacterium]